MNYLYNVALYRIVYKMCFVICFLHFSCFFDEFADNNKRKYGKSGEFGYIQYLCTTC